jgi:hypothetical protein
MLATIKIADTPFLCNETHNKSLLKTVYQVNI